MNWKFVVSQLGGWLAGIIVVAIGILNIGWGNDMGFGIFLLLLSLVFFPPLNLVARKWTGFSVHWALKILLFLFIAWAALGVGELFPKLQMLLGK